MWFCNEKAAFRKWVGQSFNMKIPSYLQYCTCTSWLNICLLGPLLQYGACLVHTYVASAKHSAWHILSAGWVVPWLIAKFTEGTLSIKYDLIESFLQLLSPFYRWRNSCLEVMELSLQSNLMRFKQISLPSDWDFNSINVRNLTEYLSATCRSCESVLLLRVCNQLVKNPWMCVESRFLHDSSVSWRKVPWVMYGSKSDKVSFHCNTRTHSVNGVN